MAGFLIEIGHFYSVGGQFQQSYYANINQP